MIYPIYDDSWLTLDLCVGEPMDNVTNLPLKPELIRAYVLEIMEPEEVYNVEELREVVTERHLEFGGLPPTGEPKKQFSKAMNSLVKRGLIDRPSQGLYRLAENSGYSQ